VRDVFERFEFHTQIERLAKAGLLYQVTEKFARSTCTPTWSATQMGLVFEELIRKFAEISNETAGEHFTPREVIRLMVNLLFIEDDEVLTPSPAWCAPCTTPPPARAACSAWPANTWPSTTPSQA
jgi:type I restriction enzyme M protein